MWCNGIDPDICCVYDQVNIVFFKLGVSTTLCVKIIKTKTHLPIAIFGDTHIDPWCLRQAV